MHARTLRYFVYILLFVCALSPVAYAEEQDETLTLLGQPPADDPVAGRLPRQLSHTAENTTVVTATEIEALNAHTLTDILAAIPGIQLENLIGPGNVASVRIQGSYAGHVLVLLDGVPYSNLGDNFADISLVPARIIERVEIVKGAASSAWGQALGGVINVITKAPDPERRVGGTLSYSQGERGTRDAGGQLSGTLDRLGYYLSAGTLESGGFRPNTGYFGRNAHARFTLELPRQGQAGLFLNYADSSRGDLAFQPLNVQNSDTSHQTVMGLSLRQPFGSHLELELNAHHSVNQSSIATGLLDPAGPDLFGTSLLKNDERASGGGARLLWRQSGNLLVAGVDYRHVRVDTNEALVNVDILDRRTDRWGLYLNDTYSIGPLALSAGVRYDLTGTSGDQFSPSLGLTWRLTDTLLLRGYTAKGFSLPSFNLQRGSERVWTSQVGLESSAVPYLWLKGTLFRNDTWDITVPDPAGGGYLSERQIRQGYELEARTAELFNTSLRAGYSYVDAHRGSDGSVLRDVPSNTLHLGLLYDDHRYFKGLLNGRHIFWNAEPFRNGSYRGLLWDLHLNATPFSGQFRGAELFFSLRNIFNGSQYLDEIYRSNGRTAEGGVRFRF